MAADRLLGDAAAAGQEEEPTSDTGKGRFGRNARSSAGGAPSGIAALGEAIGGEDPSFAKAYPLSQTASLNESHSLIAHPPPPSRRAATLDMVAVVEEVVAAAAKMAAKAQTVEIPARAALPNAIIQSMWIRRQDWFHLSSAVPPLRAPRIR